MGHLKYRVYDGRISFSPGCQERFVVTDVSTHMSLWSAASVEELAIRACSNGTAGDFDKAVWKYTHSDPNSDPYPDSYFDWDWRPSDERLPLYGYR